MKLATSLLIAFLCIAAIAQVSSEETSKVKVLTTANFDDYVRSKSVVLVEFYAPWCGHCKRLEPVYNEAAGTIGEEEDISLAKVDATVEESLGQRFGIRGFPTIILFKNGAPSKKYEGERTTTAIVSYLRKQAGPALKPVKDASEFSTLSDVAYVGYFANNRSKLYKSYSSVAENLRDNFAFFIVSDASVAKGLHFDKEGIYVLAASSDKPVAYGGASTVNSISDWVWENSLPVASRYKADLKNRYKGRGFPVLKVLTTNSDIKNVEEKLTDLLKKLSQDVSGVLTYVLSTFEENQSENNEFGLKSSPFQAYIHDEMNSMKYKYEGDDSYENLKDWVERYASGALVPFIRSEPVPETQGDVKVVVGNNFKDIVLDPSKDVLLEIYAPWCGHCKKLEPTYNELGAKLKNVGNVVIAKLDGTANDVPRAAFKASGFPTILLIPAHNKNNPIPYKGARTVEEFEKFIKDNVKTWNVISAESNPSKDEL